MIDHICNRKGRNYTEPPRGATGYHTAYATVDNRFCVTKKEKVISKDMAQKTEISEEAKAVIQRNIEARQQSSKFFKPPTWREESVSIRSRKNGTSRS